METIVLQATGALVFFVGSIVLAGRFGSKHVDRLVAERVSRTGHLLFWVGILLPGMIGIFYPGLTHYDHLLGLAPLPLHSIHLVVGLPLLLFGSILMLLSNRFLIQVGRGAAAFMLTERLVDRGIYRRTRNPMSLGFYAVCVGAGVSVGSTAVTLAALLVLIPIHLFFLKKVEERELGVRYGETYLAYKREVPFLLPRLREE